MTQKKKNAFATPADIRSMLSAPEVIEAAGLRLQLLPPTAAAAMEIRQQLFSEVAKDESSAGGVLFQAARLSVAACLEAELNEEEAAQLVMRAGGESSPLAKAAMRLCGLDSMFVRGEKAADPLPFLSREKPAVH